MQPVKAPPDLRLFDHSGMMAGIYAENKMSSQHKKLLRMLTVGAYLLCVSLAAILLSLYYLFLWNPDMQKDLSDIQSGFAKELCSAHHHQHQQSQQIHQQHLPFFQRLIQSQHQISDSNGTQDNRVRVQVDHALEDNGSGSSSSSSIGVSEASGGGSVRGNQRGGNVKASGFNGGNGYFKEIGTVSSWPTTSSTAGIGNHNHEVLQLLPTPAYTTPSFRSLHTTVPPVEPEVQAPHGQREQQQQQQQQQQRHRGANRNNHTSGRLPLTRSSFAHQMQQQQHPTLLRQQAHLQQQHQQQRRQQQQRQRQDTQKVRLVVNSLGTLDDLVTEGPTAHQQDIVQPVTARSGFRVERAEHLAGRSKLLQAQPLLPSHDLLPDTLGRSLSSHANQQQHYHRKSRKPQDQNWQQWRRQQHWPLFSVPAASAAGSVSASVSRDPNRVEGPGTAQAKAAAAPAAGSREVNVISVTVAARDLPFAGSETGSEPAEQGDRDANVGGANDVVVANLSKKRGADTSVKVSDSSSNSRDGSGTSSGSNSYSQEVLIYQEGSAAGGGASASFSGNISSFEY